MDLLARNGLSGLPLDLRGAVSCVFSSRLAVWTAAGLAFAFFGTFLLMPVLGVSMNMISMFGFLSSRSASWWDDAIVVGENVQRRLEAAEGRRRSGGDRRRPRGPAAGFPSGVLTTHRRLHAALRGAGEAPEKSSPTWPWW